MAKLSDTSPEGTQRVLVYGPAKVGKSELVGKLAEHFNLIWFDLENGHSVLYKLPKEWQQKIELICIPDTSVIPMASETMLKVIKGNECNICELHGKVQCMHCMKNGLPSTKVRLDHTLDRETIVVIDSLTQFTISCIAQIKRDQDDLYKMQTDDWGNLAALAEILLTGIQGAKYNVICISHETESKLVDGTVRIVPVTGSRNTSRNVAKYFDHVIYANVKNGKHRFGSSTTYTNNIVTGSRTDVRLEDMEEASLLDIMKGKVGTIKSPTPGQVALNSLAGLANSLSAKDNPLNQLKKGTV